MKKRKKHRKVAQQEIALSQTQPEPEKKPAKPKKMRLDKLMVEKGLAPTRSKAAAYVMAGEVYVNGQKADKAGYPHWPNAEIEHRQTSQFVGRGAHKMIGALDEFDIDVTNAICADVGACTGGFTDVLLQRGAARVHAIDVGYGQLDWRLRQDERVVVIERTNARYLEDLGEKVNMVVIDVSFISLRLILPAVKLWIDPDVNIVALIKPQFEAGKDNVGKGGIVKETAVHRSVLENILKWCTENDLVPHGLTRSSITGTDGNIEFLVWLRTNGDGINQEAEINRVLEIEA